MEGSSYNFKLFGVAANTRAFSTTKHQFKLNLYNATILTDVGTGIITLSPYSFVSFKDILGNIDMDYLIDVIGILSSVGLKRVYERNRVATKLKVIELESNGYNENNENVVVVAQYLEGKLYNGKVQLQNAMNSIKLLFNREISEAEKLKYSGSVADDLDAGVIHNDINDGVVQDLGIKFENVATEEKYGDNGSSFKHIEENAAESSLVKRGIDEVADENDEANSRIANNIKIEKE
ncbi:hypothetical protein RYX36_030818 [Vicia faba]